MAEITTDVLQQALKLLIEDSKKSRLRVDQAMAGLTDQLASLAKQSEQTKLELASLAKQTQAELASLAKQTQAELASLSEESKRTERQVQQTNKQMGELSQRMGTLVEDMISPDMLRILRLVANLPEETEGLVNVRVKRYYRGAVANGHAHMIELDAVAECGDYILVNETKTTFRPEYVTDFLEKLAIMRDYFPEFGSRPVFASISSLRIDPSVALRASRQGLLVLTLAEGMLQFQNEPGFQPKPF